MCIEEMFMRTCALHSRCRVAALYADPGPGATGRTWRGRALRQLPMPECQMHANTHAHAQMYSCSCHSLHLHARIRRRAHSRQICASSLACIRRYRVGLRLDAHKSALRGFLTQFKGLHTDFSHASCQKKNKLKKIKKKSAFIV